MATSPAPLSISNHNQILAGTSKYDPSTLTSTSYTVGYVSAVEAFIYTTGSSTCCYQSSSNLAYGGSYTLYQESRFKPPPGSTSTYLSGSKSSTSVVLPSSDTSLSYAVNSSGEIAGFMKSAQGVNEVYTIIDQKLQSFDLPQATEFGTLVLTDTGKVTGSYVTRANLSKFFVLRNGKFTTISPQTKDKLLSNLKVISTNILGDIEFTYTDKTGNLLLYVQNHDGAVRLGGFLKNIAVSPSSMNSHGDVVFNGLSDTTPQASSQAFLGVCAGC